MPDRPPVAPLCKVCAVLRRRWALLVVLPLLGALVGLAIGPVSGQGATPVHTATASIAVDEARVSKVAANQAMVQLRERPATRGSSFDVSFSEPSFTIYIEASAADAETARRNATVVAETFLAEANAVTAAPVRAALERATLARDRARSALVSHLEGERAAPFGPVEESERSVLEARLGAAQVALDDLASTADQPPGYELITVGEAKIRESSKLEILGSPGFRLLLGAVLGLAAAVGIAVAVERLNPRIDDEITAASIVGAPVVAKVPRLGRVERRKLQRVHPDDFAGPHAEAHRTLRTHLEHRRKDEGSVLRPRVMVASAGPGEGKSTTAAFLAMAYAEANQSPMLIGGDLRRSVVHRLFDVAASPGIADRHRLGRPTVKLTDLVHHDPTSGVTVIPSGPHLERVTEAVDDIAAITDAAQAAGRQVIVDTAPVGVANDATQCLGAVDWVVVVVRAGRSTVRSVAQTVASLRLNGATVVGVVVVESSEAAAAARAYDAYYAPIRHARRARAATGRSAEAASAPELVAA